MSKEQQIPVETKPVGTPPAAPEGDPTVAVETVLAQAKMACVQAGIMREAQPTHTTGRALRDLSPFGR